MKSNSDYFLHKTLGEDFLESLSKTELWKPSTKTTLDHEEIKTALQIVPRVLMSILIRELSSMKIGENKEIHIPVQTVPALIRVTKHERDVYSGQIEHEGKVVAEFKYRSIPGVGLVVLSAFELYDLSELQKPRAVADLEEVQKLIDERLKIKDLALKTLEEKISRKEAINQLLLMKLTEMLDRALSQKDQDEKERKIKENIADLEVRSKIDANENEYFRGMANGIAVADAIVNNTEPKFVKPKLPLKKFLDSRKKKLKKNEYSVVLAKGEGVSCPDCGKNIFDGKIFAGCICLGEDMKKRVYIKKTESGIKVRFSKSWDPENIEMLVDILRRKNG